MFRQIAKNLVAFILKLEAKLILKKYRPKVVAITGSVGKTGTKEAIASVLATKYRVRASQKSFNSELGVPLTILGCDNAWWSVIGWSKIFLEGLGLILFRSVYPEWLVLEVGVDRPGDMKMMLSWLKIDAAVITSLPEVPVHVEFFESPEAVIEEKWFLAQSVKSSDFVIFNYDDEKIKSRAVSLNAKLVSYGLSKEADISSGEPVLKYNTENKDKIIGLSFEAKVENQILALELNGILGKHQVYPILAGLAVAKAYNLDLTKVVSALNKLKTAPGRMRLITGVKETLIIDDTYNASPAALSAALEALGDLRVAGRKIAVLGDMMELGKYTIDEHRKVGLQAARVAHVVIAVGLRMKFALEMATKKKMGKKSLYHFNDSREAGEFLQSFIESGDVILVKGSQSLRMERVVEEIMAEPEKKKELLVRQEKEWQNR